MDPLLGCFLKDDCLVQYVYHKIGLVNCWTFSWIWFCELLRKLHFSMRQIDDFQIGVDFATKGLQEDPFNYLWFFTITEQQYGIVMFSTSKEVFFNSIFRKVTQININPKLMIANKLRKTRWASCALNKFCGLSHKTIPKQVYVWLLWTYGQLFIMKLWLARIANDSLLKFSAKF